MIITLKEYAEKHGRALVSARSMAARGGFKTARKQGRDWVIDSEEPYPDRRRKDAVEVERYHERPGKHGFSYMEYSNGAAEFCSETVSGMLKRPVDRPEDIEFNGDGYTYKHKPLEFV